MKDFDKESTKLDLLVSFIILGLLALIVYFILSGIFSFAGGILDGEIGKSAKDYSREEIQERIENHLYEKYGEEFVVDRIGRRRGRNDEFYQMH